MSSFLLTTRHTHLPFKLKTWGVNLKSYEIGVGEAHFVAVPSSAKVPPATVTAEVVVGASLNDGVFQNTGAKNGSFSVRASERSAYVIDDLASGQAYDVFFVIEVCQWNTCRLASTGRGGGGIAPLRGKFLDCYDTGSSKYGRGH